MFIVSLRAIDFPEGVARWLKLREIFGYFYP
jgi:hypothetical protein